MKTARRKTTLVARMQALSVGMAVGLVLLWATPKRVKAAEATGFKGFDVVSVKPNKSGNAPMRIQTLPNTLQVTNMPTKMLISNAYGIRQEQIFGLPKWAEASSWDISAKILDDAEIQRESRLSREDSVSLGHAKMSSILSDRFGLHAHTQKKELPIYELIKLPGRVAPKPTSTPQGAGGFSVRNQSLSGKGVSISSLVQLLAGEMGRIVVDKTGLSGQYDIDLHWSAETDTTGADDGGSLDSPAPIATALQEQLGLKLVRTKGLVDTLVIDSIQEPSPN